MRPLYFSIVAISPVPTMTFKKINSLWNHLLPIRLRAYYCRALDNFSYDMYRGTVKRLDKYFASEQSLTYKSNIMNVG